MKVENILFRGKDIKTGEWRFGYYWYGKATGTHIIMLPNSSAEVNPETVGQWTGLTDKNGVKIFEGDVILLVSFTPDKFAVEFIDGSFCLVCGESPYGHEITYACDGYIIGNIHDNPELLKEGE